MGTQLRQWTIRLLAAGALPVMLTLGAGAAASAQPTQASHVMSSEHGPHYHYEVYGPFDSYRACVRAQRQYRGHDSYCAPQNQRQHGHSYQVWYLYVRYVR